MPVATFAGPGPAATRALKLRLDALDAGAEVAQTLVDPLVAAVDLPDVPDRGRALGAKRGDQHGHAGADVRAGEPFAVQLRRAGHDRAVRIAEDDPRAHRNELVDEEEPALEHLFEHEHGAVRLRRGDDGNRRQIGRESGPGSVLDLRDLPAEIVLDFQPLTWRNTHRRPLDLDPDAETPERRQDRDQVA